MGCIGEDALLGHIETLEDTLEDTLADASKDTLEDNSHRKVLQHDFHKTVTNIDSQSTNKKHQPNRQSCRDK